jgi:hypothetical protein
MNIEDRVNRLQSLINEGRIIRNDWSGTDEQGRETACLLAALSPEVAEQETASACPADVMPAWLAHLTPWMDDNVSEYTWPSAIRRYAACAARWPTLDNAAWRRVEIAARRACVAEAMRHTAEERVLDAHRAVLAWLDDDMPEQPHEGLWAAAQVAAAWAVEAAAESARAEAAAEAEAEAADRITDAILSALEKECGL